MTSVTFNIDWNNQYCRTCAAIPGSDPNPTGTKHHSHPREPAHPAGTHQLCCDTTSVPSRPFSVPSEHFGIHPFNALFLLPDLLAIRSAIRISAELIMNSRGTQSSPLCWESVVWKMDIPSLSETQTSILKCNYPETLTREFKPARCTYLPHIHKHIFSLGLTISYPDFFD